MIDRIDKRWRRRLAVVLALLVLTAGMLAAERIGLNTRHPYKIGGDLRRESRLFEQYGQAGSAVVIALLIWRLDPPRRRMLPAIGLTLLINAGVITVLKQTIGRARPAAHDAGQFYGPSAEGNSKRESFPSGHTAAAVATTVVLAAIYPRAAGVFWGLALACAGLRYVNNAHWPSDVLAGITVGYVSAIASWHVLVERRHRPHSPDILPSDLRDDPPGTLRATQP